MLYLFILLRIIVNPLGNVFQKQLTDCRGANPVVVNCITYVLLAVACVCIGFPFVEVGAQLSTNYVFENMHVGYALALFQLSTLLSVALGYKMFNERNVLKKAIGSLIMIVGSVMIILW